MKSTLAKAVISIVALLIAMSPTIAWFIARSLLNPAGFWQEFVLLGLGVFFVFGLQVMLGIFCAIGLFMLWTK